MFHKSLTDLLRARVDVEEYAEVLVRGAVSDALRAVAMKFGLDERALRDEFLEDLVGKHSKLAGVTAKCEYVTYRKRKCGRDAMAHGFCSLHMPPAAVQDPPAAARMLRATVQNDTRIAELLRLTTTARDRCGPGGPSP
jgi:hypothetical protein